jgi:hypothetical protein
VPAAPAPITASALRLFIVGPIADILLAAA